MTIKEEDFGSILQVCIFPLTLFAVSKPLGCFGVGLRSSSLNMAMVEVILRSIHVRLFTCYRMHMVLRDYSQGTLWDPAATKRADRNASEYHLYH